MVDRPLTFDYDELLAMPLVEQYVTIACVSNEVGGDLVGNALWRGVRLRDAARSAPASRPGATQVVGRVLRRLDRPASRPPGSTSPTARRWWRWP